jgi:sporulation protein YlmC with PRC-barrel domain
MKRGVLTLAALAALVALPALADPAEVPADVFLTTQGEGQYLARDLLLFAKVQNAEGEIIGDVEDLILNADNNQVVGVVMGVGGFAGFGEKRVGVPLGALQIKNDDGKVTVSLPQASQAVLDAVEPFKRTTPPKSLLDRAIERARELSAKSAVTAKEAYDKAKEQAAPALEKASEAAKDAYEDVKEKAAPAIEKAGDVAKGAYEGAREALEAKPEATPESTPAPEATPPAEPAPEQPPAQP